MVSLAPSVANQHDECWLNRFLLILIPCGPSAMLLVNIAETVGIDQGPVAGYLTISVSLPSPLWNFTSRLTSNIVCFCASDRIVVRCSFKGHRCRSGFVIHGRRYNVQHYVIICIRYWFVPSLHTPSEISSAKPGFQMRPHSP
jgi:hypothetical protein